MLLDYIHELAWPIVVAGGFRSLRMAAVQIAGILAAKRDRGAI